MKNMLFILLAALLAANTAQAQTNPTDNTLFRHIPADADQVFDIHLSRLIAKADFMSLMKTMQGQNFGGGNGDGNPMSHIKNIFKAGVDLRQDLIIAQKTAPALTDSAGYMTIIAHLTDSGKFVAFMRSNSTKDAYAWNDKIAVMVIVKRPKHETVDPATSKKDYLIAKHRATAALHGFEHSFYTTNENFKTGFSDDADIHIWNLVGSQTAGLSKIMQMVPGGASPQAQGLSQYMKNAPKSHTLSAIRFQPGKIVFTTKRFLTGSDSAAAALFAGHAVSTSMLASIPKGKLLGLLAVHLDPTAMLDNLQKNGLDTKIDSSLKARNLSLQDIFHGFTGDFMLLAYAPDTGKAPLIYGAANIGDRPSFDKVFAQIKHFADSAANDSATHKKPQLFFSIQNNMIAISGTQKRVDGFFDHPAGASSSRLLTDELRADPSFVAVDMQTGADYLANILKKGDADTLAAKDQKLLDIVRRIDAFVVAVQNQQDGQIKVSYELSFTDRNKNALASLMEIASELARSKGHQ